MKTNILKHIATQDFFDKIKPAKSFVPEWYKKGERMSEDSSLNSLPIKHGFKLCSAFSDSFTTGYMVPLTVDIAVKQTSNGPVITWNDPQSDVLILRSSDTNNTIPTPMGCSDLHFVWKTKHIYEIPKGYSAIFTHPLNRFDLPFFTLTGVIDDFVMPVGHVPVFFSSTFEGIIPAGTPIAQIIPFKRENWDSKEDKSLRDKGNYNNFLSSRKAYGWYKQNIWKKKTYN